MYPKVKKQSGAAIVAAIFLIMILALMATGMVNLLATSQQSISHEITSAKTYMAGHSCLQWAKYQLVNNTDWSSGADNTAGDKAEVYTMTFNSPVSGGLRGSKCLININTILRISDSGSDYFYFYNIKVVATYGSKELTEYSERTMQEQYQMTGS